MIAHIIALFRVFGDPLCHGLQLTFGFVRETTTIRLFVHVRKGHGTRDQGPVHASTRTRHPSIDADAMGRNVLGYIITVQLGGVLLFIGKHVIHKAGNSGGGRCWRIGDDAGHSHPPQSNRHNGSQNGQRN